MARTFVQQSQISGSLAFNDTLEAGSALAGKQTLVGDLDALRSQVNKIIGGDRWYDALSGSQSLAAVYGAMQVYGGTNADFLGNVSVNGDVFAVSGSFNGALSVNGEIFGNAGISTNGNIDALNGDLNAINATLIGDLGAVNATLSGDLGAVNATLSGDLGAVDATLSGNLSAVDATLTGSLWAVNATLSGDLFAVTGSFTGPIAAEAAYISGPASVAGPLTAQDSLSVTGQAYVQGHITGSADLRIGGDAYFSALEGYEHQLVHVGANGEISVATNLYFDESMLQVTGSLDVSGPAVMNDGLTVTGDRLEVTGSFGLTGAADLDSTLSVDGAVTLGAALDVAGIADFDAAVYMASSLGVSGSLAVAQAAAFAGGISVSGAVADFNSDVTANKISIDSDVSGRLYIVDADGSIKDEANLNFAAGELSVTGSLKVTSGAVVEGTLNVDGAADFDSTADFAGAVVMQSSLDVDGAVDFDSTLNVAGNAVFQANVQIDGDLRVKGAMTYIDTQNMRVEDAFIYLATGSLGTSDSGIVLHGGAGANMDLVIGQDGGAGEVIFGKGNRAPDGDGAMSGISLVPAWMSTVKLGGLEGSASGSLGIDTAGVRLLSESDKDITIGASRDLLLSANNETAISFIEAGESAAFDSKFDATSIVGALNELFDMIGGGSAAKGDLSSANVAAGVLTFSSVGTLTAAEHKLIDVYLNGVLLSPSRDLSSLTTTTVTLDSAIASGLMVEDVITVVIRSAA
jgi:cytoskeletal protein CcmA (bactofilin family)